jgi:hypothetical protein
MKVTTWYTFVRLSYFGFVFIFVRNALRYFSQSPSPTRNEKLAFVSCVRALWKMRLTNVRKTSTHECSVEFSKGYLVLQNSFKSESKHDPSLTSDLQISTCTSGRWVQGNVRNYPNVRVRRWKALNIWVWHDKIEMKNMRKKGRWCLFTLNEGILRFA